MARVTVEDCVRLVPNRFKLVMLAAQRARELSVGAEMTVEKDNDKNPVVALREIADQTIDLGTLEASLVSGLQKHVEIEETEEELEEQRAAEDALIAASVARAVGAAEDETAPGKGAEAAPDFGGENVSADEELSDEDS